MGTPKLIRQFTSRSAGNIMMVHQLDVGAARRSSAEYEKQFKRRIKISTEEQIVKEDLSSEDDEAQLERRSADKSKLEEFLKSGCKQEETKRYLNGLKKQPAQTIPAR
ncbi:splicing factor 3B subunit 3-like [Dorcoceras hygrometricum]|uniref:Splicing factor 3B subunit 3-like n=1 Tax=Dorcoceras hygrometricum TaxID=472368 RepID=A0A2Z7B167_9LAMI|nr:splicing factor 3B subunit 3-like [Dorcoceras hygrometricum]